MGTRADEIQELLRKYAHLFTHVDDEKQNNQRENAHQHAAVFIAMKCLMEGLELPLNTTTHNVELVVLTNAADSQEDVDDIRAFTAPIVSISQKIRSL